MVFQAQQAGVLAVFASIPAIVSFPPVSEVNKNHRICGSEYLVVKFGNLGFKCETGGDPWKNRTAEDSWDGPD